MPGRPDSLLTVREIAERLGETKARVHAALRQRGVVILPAARASQTMLYDPSVLPIVRTILNATQLPTGPQDGGP